jgi:HK97 family phage portal protein
LIFADGLNATIAPQAFGETSPLFYQGYFVPRQGLQLETAFQTYSYLYRTQPWVAVVVNKIANLIARLGINCWDESEESGKDLDTTSPYAKLLANPCPWMDPFSFWNWTASTIEIYGETYWIKERNKTGRIVGFTPMHPALTQIKRKNTGDLEYRFMGIQSDPYSIIENDVVAFRSFNPDGYMRGMSRLEPLRATLMSEDSSRRASQSFFANMGRPSVVLSTDKILGPDGRDRVRQGWQSQHSGSSNVGKVAVFEDGIAVTPVQLTAEEMQYIQCRKLNREEVAAVYDIPPTAIHILDKATYSNITEQMRSVYRDSMAPRIEFIESVIDYSVGKEFNGTKKARFAVAEVLRGDFEHRATSVALLVDHGIMKPSEARPLFDLDDEGEIADKLYALAMLQELGRPAERITIAAQEAPGVTPSGIPIAGAPAPGTNPNTGAAPPHSVPAVNGQQAHSIPQATVQYPAPPAAHSVPAVGGGPSHSVPTAQKYVRDIAGKIGRGWSLQAAAKHLVETCPDDWDAIEAACAHIIEREAA